MRMEHDPFLPHWTHKQCGGVVTGRGDIYRCLKCNREGAKLGVLLPPDTTNTFEYFNCHPELEVEFVNGEGEERQDCKPVSDAANW